MARKRKRKTVDVPWTPALAVALGINIAGALLYSPLFALTHVRVIGFQGDHAGLEEELQGVANQPAPWSRATVVETGVQNIPGVDHASLRVNLFGRGVMDVTMRKPVARLEDSRIALGPDGELWRLRVPEPDLVAVSLPSEAYAPTAALARPISLAAVADLAMRLKQVWPGFDGEITLNSAGIICLNRGQSGRVVLGGSEALDEKLRRLADLLQAKPELFSSPTEVNLTSPKRPAFSRIAPQTHEAVEYPSVSR